ncbi:MAG: PH domain-containing protein [Patescibacteria group bacterium]|jgi:hypothetical protein
MGAESLIKLRLNEKILEIVHEDFVPALPWWIFLFFWIAAPFFFLVPLIQRGVEGVLFFVVVVGMGVFMVSRSYFAWQRTVLIVTDQRIIDLVQHGFLEGVVTEVELKDIEEVSYHIKGLWPTVFRYGTIYLRTAGDRADLAFRHTHRPIELYHLLNDLIKICRY